MAISMAAWKSASLGKVTCSHPNSSAAPREESTSITAGDSICKIRSSNASAAAAKPSRSLRVYLFQFAARSKFSSSNSPSNSSAPCWPY